MNKREVRMSVELLSTDERGELADVQYRESQRIDTRWFDQMTDADIGLLVRAMVGELKGLPT